MDIRKFFFGKTKKDMGESEDQDGEKSVDTDSDTVVIVGAAAGSVVESHRNLTDIGDIECGPAQPKLAQYPYKQCGMKKQRSFQYHWFDSFKWLEYSVQGDAAFCFPCKQFGPKQNRYKQDALSSHGFDNWKRALESFREHEKSAVHNASTCAWAAFRSGQMHGDVMEQLEATRTRQNQDRQEYLRRILAVITFLGGQGLALRGHDETKPSKNKGNFVECLNLLKKFDPFLQKYQAPANATYMSPSSQNDIIASCSEVVVSHIVNEIQKAGMYAVMADEARSRNKEQLAVCVRYVVPETGFMKEHFLGFSELQKFDAESIVQTIQTCVEENALTSAMCVAQTYDGASVMSGSTAGVQARFREHHPKAIYVHCYAHELNLVLCHTCKAIKEAANFFDMMENVYTIFNVSLKNHHQFLIVQDKLGLKNSELVQLSQTRWSCQVRSVKAMIANFPAVLECLLQIQSPTSTGLHASLIKLETLYFLFMFDSLLSTTEGLHKVLQQENLDLAKAVDFMDAVRDTLKDMRTEENGKILFNKAVELAEANNIDIESLPAHRRRKQRRMDDFVVESTLGFPESEEIHASESDKLTTRLFYPCIDRMLGELNQRFSTVDKDLMVGIQACNPRSRNFLNAQDMRAIAKHYDIPLKSEEVLVALNYVRTKQRRRSLRFQPHLMCTIFLKRICFLH